jgi:EF hand
LIIINSIFWYPDTISAAPLETLDDIEFSNDDLRHEAGMKLFFALWISFAASAGAAFAQSRNDSVTRRSTDTDTLVAWAMVWGDIGRAGVFTCDEWKRYATKLFNDADKNRDGYLSEDEFKGIRAADPMLKSADIAYFDDNRDGRVSRSEFIDKPNRFFVKYDRKRECRVTYDTIMDVAAESDKIRERPRR